MTGVVGARAAGRAILRGRPSSVKGALRASLRDRLRRPLTPEPLRPLTGRKSGQGRALPAGCAARGAGGGRGSHDGPSAKRAPDSRSPFLSWLRETM